MRAGGNGAEQHQAAAAQAKGAHTAARETGDWDDPDMSILDDRRGELPDLPIEVFPQSMHRWMTRCGARRRRHRRSHRAAADRHSLGPDRRGAPGAGHPLVAAADDVLDLPGRRCRARARRRRSTWSSARCRWWSAVGNRRTPRANWRTRRASSAPRRRSRNGRTTLPPRSTPGSRRRSSRPRRRTCARSWCRASTSPTARSSGWRRCSRRGRAA